MIAVQPARHRRAARAHHLHVGVQVLRPHAVGELDIGAEIQRRARGGDLLEALGMFACRRAKARDDGRAHDIGHRPDRHGTVVVVVGERARPVPGQVPVGVAGERLRTRRQRRMRLGRGRRRIAVGPEPRLRQQIAVAGGVPGLRRGQAPLNVWSSVLSPMLSAKVRSSKSLSSRCSAMRSNPEDGGNAAQAWVKVTFQCIIDDRVCPRRSCLRLRVVSIWTRFRVEMFMSTRESLQSPILDSRTRYQNSVSHHTSWLRTENPVFKYNSLKFAIDFPTSQLQAIF